MNRATMAAMWSRKTDGTTWRIAEFSAKLDADGYAESVTMQRVWLVSEPRTEADLVPERLVLRGMAAVWKDFSLRYEVAA